MSGMIMPGMCIACGSGASCPRARSHRCIIPISSRCEILMRKLGQRIKISQRDEIGMMQRWLRARGQDAPDPHAMHMPGMIMPDMDHGPMMPGMLTPDEMEHLASLKGVEFDRAFLTGMIKHHGGAPP